MRTRNLIALLLVLPATAGRAQYWDEQVITPPLDVTSTARFGWSLSMEGDYLLVGAPGADDIGPNAGAAFIFRREEGGTNEWDLIARLSPPLLSEDAGFGTTVMLHNGQAFVGAPRQRFGVVQAGAVFVFGQDEGGSDVWGYRQRLTAPDPVAGLEFGASLELNGDTLITGVPGLLPDTGPDGSQAGGFAKFVRSGDGSWADEGTTYLRWAGDAGLVYSGLFLSTKTANDGTSAGYFLPIDLFWSPTDPANTSPGELELKAFWQHGNPWNWDQVMHNPESVNLSGPTMASSGEYVAVADEELVTLLVDPTPNPDLTTTEAVPLVVVITRSNNAALIVHGFAREPDNLPSSRFGHSVAFSPDRLVIGCPGPSAGSPVGKVRLFGIEPVADTDSLPLLATLYPTYSAFGDLFGWALAANEGMIAVGAPGHGEDDRGQVHVFFDPTTGLQHASAGPEDTWVIRPNPASDYIEVNRPRAPGEATVELIDVTGRTVLRVPVRRAVERIDVAALVPGPYNLVVYRGNDPSSRTSSRVIIFR